MGIYIKEMEIPTSCVGCKLWYLIPLADTMEDICRVTGHRVNPYRRADDCPLIPVPDHGDLIDRDALEVHDGWMSNDRERNVLQTHITFVYSNDVIDAPTIIPGEDTLYDSLKRGLEQAINGEYREETVIIPADKDGDNG